LPPSRAEEARTPWISTNFRRLSEALCIYKTRSQFGFVSLRIEPRVKIRRRRRVVTGTRSRACRRTRTRQNRRRRNPIIPGRIDRFSVRVTRIRTHSPSKAAPRAPPRVDARKRPWKPFRRSPLRARRRPGCALAHSPWRLSASTTRQNVRDSGGSNRRGAARLRLQLVSAQVPTGRPSVQLPIFTAPMAPFR
jgi:hypothetical protein